MEDKDSQSRQKNEATEESSSKQTETLANVNRRKFLQTSGAAAAGLALIPVASAKKQKGSDARIVKGTARNPVALEQMENARQAAVDDFNDRGGDLAAAPVRTKPADDHDGSIVAYVYTIGEDGIPRQYTGIAEEEASVDELHQKASDRAKQFAQNDNSPQSETQEVTTQATSWEQIHHDEKDFCSDPHGCVTDNFILYKLTDDGDYSQDAYGIKHIFAMEPGWQKYDSNWVNWIGYPMHDWSKNSMGGEDLAEWDPLGTNDGSMTISVSVGTGGAGLGWSYTQPAVTTIDDSSPSSNFAKWSEEFNSYDARRNTNGMKPGSSAWLNQQANGSGYHSLMDLIAEGEFHDMGWGAGYYTLKWTWHIDVYY